LPLRFGRKSLAPILLSQLALALVLLQLLAQHSTYLEDSAANCPTKLPPMAICRVFSARPATLMTALSWTENETTKSLRSVQVLSRT
jgi:hypothetical protein